MRKIGTYPDQQIQVLVDYLTAEGVASKAVAGSDGGFELWVIDEDHLERAKQALIEFKNDPGDSRYSSATKKAKLVRKELRDKKQRIERNVRLGKQSFHRRSPVIFVVAAVCVFAAIMSNYSLDFSQPIVQSWSFDFTEIVNPAQLEAAKFVSRNPQSWNSVSVTTESLQRGELWRLFTPALLHGSIMHLVFNLLVFVPFGRRIESNEGRWFTVGLILASAAIPNFVQGVLPQGLSGTGIALLSAGAQNIQVSPFCGISGVCFAFVSFIWARGQKSPVFDYRIQNSTMIYLVVIIAIGFLGLDEKILNMHLANWAHAVGAVVGVLAAYLPVGRSAKS